jgi:serine/threonine protein kinase
MASVYRAYEPVLDRYVALKVLPTEFISEAGFAHRFEREAKVIARLEHPNIIPIFSYGIEPAGRIPWMAMRLIAGGSLSSRLTDSRPSHDDIVTIISAVAEALQYAHGKGVIHRDVKPPNILLDESGGIYLADFGIARMVEGTSALTQAGMLTGTPQYMAPEQAVGGTVDHRCDIYALGVVAYQMLVGTVPFTADTPIAVLMKQISDPIPVPAPETVPERMMHPVLKCLAKKPEDRWQSATDFARALEEGRVQSADTQEPANTRKDVQSAVPPAATVVRRSVPAPKATIRRRFGPLGVSVALAGALGLSLLIGSVWLVHRSVTARDSRPSPGATPSTLGPTALGTPSLAIDLQVTQAVGAVTDALSLRFEIDGQNVRELSLRFPADEQPVRRESVTIEGLSTGSHHLHVVVRPEGSPPSSDIVHGDKDLNLAEGVNRLPVNVFVGPDSVFQFQ